MSSIGLNVEHKHCALYALSADPITFGHINIVERVSRIFDEVIVGIGSNPAKSYLFKLEERLALAKSALSHLPNVRVVAFKGMLVDFALEEGAQVIVKGVRNSVDFNYEQHLHQVGMSQEAGIDTHILFADPELAHISSSVVKGIQLEHGLITQYVPLAVKSALEAKISNQVIIGVTGEMAAGKSTFCKKMVAEGREQKLSVHHIDADKLGHEIMDGLVSPLYQEVRKKLIALFRPDIYIDGTIQRSKIAEQVFNKPQLLLELNKVMAKPIMIQLRKSLQGKQGVILLESALLTENNLLALCNNRVLLLRADKTEMQARLFGRGYSEDDAKQRTTAQFDWHKKQKCINKQIEASGFGQLWDIDSGIESQFDISDLVSELANLKQLRIGA
jgi:pantetheine-phosphate adenylyltransferase